MNILLFGAPGSGKGTQSDRLVSKESFVHISTGNLLRDEIKRQTPLGLRAKEILDSGGLVSDEIVVEMVENILKGARGKSFIFDGFPRTLAQADSLEKMLSANQMDLDTAIFLEVPREELIRRLTGRRTCPNCGAVFHVEAKPPAAAGLCDVCGAKLIQRPDDTASVVENRLSTYLKNTEPVLDFYRSRRKLVEILGTGDVWAVSNRIDQAIHSGRSQRVR